MKSSPLVESIKDSDFKIPEERRLRLGGKIRETYQSLTSLAFDTLPHWIELKDKNRDLSLILNGQVGAIILIDSSLSDENAPHNLVQTIYPLSLFWAKKALKQRFFRSKALVEDNTPQKKPNLLRKVTSFNGDIPVSFPYNIDDLQIIKNELNKGISILVDIPEGFNNDAMEVPTSMSEISWIIKRLSQSTNLSSGIKIVRMQISSKLNRTGLFRKSHLEVIDWMELKNFSN